MTRLKPEKWNTVEGNSKNKPSEFTQKDVKDFFSLVKKQLDKREGLLPDGDYSFKSIDTNKDFFLQNLLRGNQDGCEDTLVMIAMSAFYLYCIQKDHLCRDSSVGRAED